MLYTFPKTWAGIQRWLWILLVFPELGLALQSNISRFKICSLQYQLPGAIAPNTILVNNNFIAAFLYVFLQKCSTTHKNFSTGSKLVLDITGKLPTWDTDMFMSIFKYSTLLYTSKVHTKTNAYQPSPVGLHIVQGVRHAYLLLDQCTL